MGLVVFCWKLLPHDISTAILRMDTLYTLCRSFISAKIKTKGRTAPRCGAVPSLTKIYLTVFLFSTITNASGASSMISMAGIPAFPLSAVEQPKNPAFTPFAIFRFAVT